ncbi:zinc transporter ZIP12-like [Acanthaster planci]|uniref:Zinc transporter ZIP12-like n=1 Tax=Acanthaster planci TaxID=133434 RepID=A0A8B7YP00_ACAPL|nr:zinc transporter ZIP12-like [Acanthaster planci]
MAPIPKVDFRVVCIIYLLVFGISSRLHVLAAGEIATEETHHNHGHSDSIFGDPFEEIFGQLREISFGADRNITRDETATVIHLLFEDQLHCSDNFNVSNCHKCLETDSLFSILGIQPSHGLDEENFNRACVVLMYYVADLNSTCAAAANLSVLTYEDFAQNILKRLDSTQNLSEEELEDVLDAVAKTYKANNFAKCFTAETVFEAAVANHQLGADDHELENVAAILISSLVRGFCIGNATELDPEAFLEDIFDTYATDGYLSEEKFQEIVDKLSAGSGGESVSPDPHDHAHRRRRSVLQLSAERRRDRRNAATVTHEGHDHDHDHAHEGEVSLDVHSCFSVDGLFDIFGVNHSVGVTRQQFKELSPALIQQTLRGPCVNNETTVPEGPSAAEVWGYGVLAVFIISLCAIAGVAFLPCLSTDVYLKVLQTMMALAVSTLVGDAVVHLIPQAVGLHAHDATAAGVTHDPTSEDLAYIWKCLVVVVAIYVFFVFESLMQMFGGGHSNSVKPVDDEPGERKRTSSMRLKEEIDSSPKHRSTSNAQFGDVLNEDATDERGHSPHHSKVCHGIGSLPLMILIGDGLHNLGDGLAIGAAFATSIGTGLSTSIAVFCHELPHELGDFAVLLSAGLSFRKALVFNFLSALMAFIGLCIGIPLAANAEAREWIFALAAGMFLYVALVDMFPELIHHNNKNKGTIFLLHNLGLFIGATIILVIALYEDSINISI